MNKQSLRDLKKEETLHALANAAYELALERDLDGFVVEDVVQRAGYSRRTFANHFSCKEEAVATAAVSFTGIEEAEKVLEDLPENAAPLDILYQFMKMQLTAECLRKLRVLMTLNERHPTLEPNILSVLRRLQTSAQQALSDLSGGRYPEAYTHLLAGAVYGAVLPLLDGSVNVMLPGQPVSSQPGEMTFDRYLDTAFEYLRKGF